MPAIPIDSDCFHHRTDDSLGKLAQSRIVVPLDDYISTDYVNKTYNKAAAEGVLYDGHVYGALTPRHRPYRQGRYQRELSGGAGGTKSSPDVPKG